MKTSEQGWGGNGKISQRAFEVVQAAVVCAVNWGGGNGDTGM